MVTTLPPWVASVAFIGVFVFSVITFDNAILKVFSSRFIVGLISVEKIADFKKINMFLLIPFTVAGKSSSKPICCGVTVNVPCGVWKFIGSLTLSFTAMFICS